MKLSNIFISCSNVDVKKEVIIYNDFTAYFTADVYKKLVKEDFFKLPERYLNADVEKFCIHNGQLVVLIKGGK